MSTELDKPISEMVAEWPSRRAFAEDVGARLDAVHKWVANERIPAGWQSAAVAAAQRKGLSKYNPEWMISVHARSPENAPSPSEAY